MKISNVMKVAALLTLLSGLASPAQAGQVLLAPSDLDAIIDALPTERIIDPVSELQCRLSVLNSSAAPSAERDGLELAISLIRIARQNRLVPSASLVQRPAVAGL